MYYGTKAAMELGVSSCDSSDVGEETPDILEKAMKDDAHWMDLNDVDKTYVPTLSISNIHHYFIKRKVHKNQVTATKPFERGSVSMMQKKYNVSLFIPLLMTIY